MTTTTGFKDYIDLPQWRGNAPSPNAMATAGQMVSDMRGDTDKCPFIYQLLGTAVLNAYDPTTDEWIVLASPGLATFAAGASMCFHPSQGPRGTLAAGSTTTKVVLSTALPAAVGINQLANRGDGVGYRIRIIGNATGSSGKIEERSITFNTSGTTPTIYLDSALSFTPASGDAYEIRSGRVFMMGGGTLAAGSWKYYDIATNSMSGNLVTTNLPASVGTDCNLVALSESHVPNSKTPGLGFMGSLTATAIAAGTITGHATGGDAAVLANQFRNFQIRVIQDTVNVTAVGQRRRITSHTAGASPVYTLASNWAVTPSANCLYVIENDDDKIILLTAATTVYNYNITANTWDTSTWATPVARGAGCVTFQAFGIDPTDSNGLSGNQPSMIYSLRGGAGNQIDVLDIAGAATGAWSNDIVYGKKGQTFTTGTCGYYDPNTLGGRFIHININGGQRMGRFDVKNRIMDAGTYVRFPQGAAHVGNRIAGALFIDGSTRIFFIYHQLATSAQMLSLLVQR